MEKEIKYKCWRPRDALVECVVRTKCFAEKEDVEECLTTPDCFLERKNWILCRLNAQNPRYRLRGNPYDVSTEDQRKIESRNARIKRREAEEDGLLLGSDNLHDTKKS